LVNAIIQVTGLAGKHPVLTAARGSDIFGSVSHHAQGDGGVGTGISSRPPSVALHLPVLAGLFLVVGFAFVYLSTLDDGLRPGELQGGDLITHQYAQVQGRPSNAPGYPLYTMGGWVWYRLGRLALGPGHNPIQILSSYSTVWALLSLWLLYNLILEGVRTDFGNVSGAGWPIAASVTAFYGLTYFFWYYAVTTEQYTSSVAWTLAVLWLAFRWERTRRQSHLLWIALLVGVGLAHQVTVLLLVPPILWFILSGDLELLRRPRLIMIVLGLVLLPLLSYAYVYARGAAHPEWRGVGEAMNSWQWFWSFISTRQGRGELTWSLAPFLTSEFPSLIWREMTVPGLFAGLFGLAALGRRRAVLCYASLGLYLAFCWIDRLGNWYQVIMPAYAVLALGIGVGAAWLWRRVLRPSGETNPPGERRASARLSSILRPIFVVALLVLVLYRGITSYPRADASNRPDDTGLAPGWAIVADNPPEGTAVLGTTPEALALNYLTEIWDVRPDLRTVTSTQARHVLEAGTPLLAVTESALPLVPAEVSANAHYSAFGRTLAGVTANPNRRLLLDTETPSWQNWTSDFGTDLRLIGGQVVPNPATGETVALLAWEALVRPAEDWSVSVRLTQGGAEIAQVDHQNPVAGAYPTSRWSPGEIVGDAYPFILPAGAVPRGLDIVLYHRQPDGSFVNLGIAHLPLLAPAR
jgi:hypothetical protein